MFDLALTCPNVSGLASFFLTCTPVLSCTQGCEKKKSLTGNTVINILPPHKYALPKSLMKS